MRERRKLGKEEIEGTQYQLYLFPKACKVAQDVPPATEALRPRLFERHQYTWVCLFGSFLRAIQLAS